MLYIFTMTPGALFNQKFEFLSNNKLMSKRLESVRLQGGKSEPSLHPLSFLLQVRVRGGMPKRTQHGDHLAFVVERVRDHVK